MMHFIIHRYEHIHVYITGTFFGEAHTCSWGL